MDYPKVSIITLNWNGLEDTIECLESLKTITYPNYEVIVVDNGSEGNDAQVLKEKFGGYIHLIENDKNYGYTGGNNLAIRHVLAHSPPDYFLILNNDTVVAPDFLDHLVGAAEADASIGVVGPKIYYYDSPNRIQSAGNRINMWTGWVYSIGGRQIDTGQYNKRQKVDWISGCCLLAKREVIQKVGGFDESYFFGWEEVDYCLAVRKSGYEVIYVPQSKAWHKARGAERGFQCYYAARNTFIFARKYTTKWQSLLFLARLLLLMTMSCLYRRNLRRLLYFYRGVRDGLLGWKGEIK